MLRRKEVAKILNISLGTVLRIEKKGLLHPIRILGSVRYDENEIYNLTKKKEE